MAGELREPGDGHEHDFYWSRRCGARVCDRCNWHEGLSNCYCGWSAGGGDGLRNLVEAGETIYEEDY